MPTLAIILPNVFFLESNLHRVDLRVLLRKFAILCTAHFDDVLIILCVKGAQLYRCTIFSLCKEETFDIPFFVIYLYIFA